MKRTITQRICSVFLAVMLLVGLLPTGIMASALDGTVYNDGNAYYRYNFFVVPTWYRSGYSSLTQYLPESDYTESIWQMAEGHSLYTPHYDGPYPAWAGPYESDYEDIANADYVSEKEEDFATDPWMLYGHNEEIAFKYDCGAGFVMSGSGAWISVKVLVPTAGTYTPRAFFYGWSGHADPVDLYIAPDDAENPRDTAYLAGTFTGVKNRTTPYRDRATMGSTVEITEPGEYIVTVAANGYLGFGGLELLGTAPVANEITLSYDDSFLSDEGYFELPAGDGATEIAILGESSEWGELDLAGVDAPVSSRVDVNTDAVVASYEDGVVSVEALRLDEDPYASVTFLYEGLDAAAWVELPIKVVPGSEKVLAVSHTGSTNDLMKDLARELTLTAKIDGEAAVIDTEDTVEVAAFDADGNATEDVAVDIAEDGTLTVIAAEAGDFVLKVTATVDGVALKSAYEIPITVSAFNMYFNYMKLLGQTTDSEGWQMEQFIDSYSDTWSGGCTELYPANASDGWIPGAYTSAQGWLWTSSATSYGAYWLANAVGDTNSVKIFVPMAGTYDLSSVHFAWTSSGSLNLYVDGKKLTESPLSFKGENVSDTVLPVGRVELTAGEHTVTYEEAEAVSAGYFIKGLKLQLVGEPGETLGYIDVDRNDIAFSAGSAKTLTPKVLPSFLDTEITWTIADRSVAKVDKGAVTGANYTTAHGFTTLALSGKGLQDCVIDVMIGYPAFEYKPWTAGLKVYQTGVNYPKYQDYGYYQQGYEKSQNDNTGSDPWFFAAADNGSGGVALEHGWGSSVKNQGLLAAYGTEDNAYTQMQFKLSEGGKYRIATEMDMGAVHISPSATYLAPVGAEDPTADEYLLEELHATRGGGKQNTTVLYDELALEAGEYLLTVVKLPCKNRSVGSGKGYDYLTHYDYRFYKTGNLAEVDVATVDGAQIRTSGVQGLRFISSIDKASVDFENVVEYGTILLPSADLKNKRNLVIGAEYNGHAVLKVPAVVKYAEDDASVTFTAVLTNIKVANYQRSYTARAYAILDDGTVVYGDTFSVRSIYEVAQNGLADENASEADKAVFRTIVDAVNG